jgi:hypothetical protein
MSREQQQSQHSTSQVVQIQQQQQQQSRFASSGHPQSAAHYATTASHPMYNQEANNQCKFR